MIYRPLGNTGIRLSIFSFGGMRWETEEDCHNTIQRGLDAGFNYVDTSSGYINGHSEEWLGRAIKKRRNEIYFSSKANWMSAPSADAVRASIDQALKKTGLNYLDFYQVWNCETHEILRDVLKKGGMLEGVQKAMKDGVIKHGLGFTFHGKPDVFRAAIDSGVFLCATVSYNLMNREEEEQIAYAAKKGVGVIIMNPLAGGIFGMGKDPAFDFLTSAGRDPWYGALRFLVANQNITTCITGMSRSYQVDENLIALERADRLDDAFRQDLIKKMDAIKFTEGKFCTSCEYCKECPHTFEPHKLMKSMRDFQRYGMEKKDLRSWLNNNWIFRADIDKCTECGECEARCPQKLEIVSEILRAKTVL